MEKIKVFIKEFWIILSVFAACIVESWQLFEGVLTPAQMTALRFFGVFFLAYIKAKKK